MMFEEKLELTALKMPGKINDSTEVFLKGRVRCILHKGGVFNSSVNGISGGIILRDELYNNIIVSSARVLVARRLFPGDELSYGIKYQAVGTGYGTGTENNPQEESAAYTTLRDELCRKEFSDSNYLDSEGNITTSPTTVMRFTTTFEESEANGSIVEMGLFGGNATSAIDTGYLFNYRTFPVWNKTDEMRLTVQWKIIIN